jgi:hypothetical protein
VQYFFVLRALAKFLMEHRRRIHAKLAAVLSARRVAKTGMKNAAKRPSQVVHFSTAAIHATRAAKKLIFHICPWHLRPTFGFHGGKQATEGAIFYLVTRLFVVITTTRVDGVYSYFGRESEYAAGRIPTAERLNSLGAGCE